MPTSVWQVKPSPRIRLERPCYGARGFPVVAVGWLCSHRHLGDMTRELALFRVRVNFLHPLCPTLHEQPCSFNVGFEPFIVVFLTARTFPLDASTLGKLRVYQDLDAHSVWCPCSFVFQVWLVTTLVLPFYQTIFDVPSDTDFNIGAVQVSIRTSRKDIT